jgi:hypothetical protein
VIVEDTPDLNLNTFNDKASSILTYPGPDYEEWKRKHRDLPYFGEGHPPVVALYDHANYKGKILLVEDLGNYDLAHSVDCMVIYTKGSGCDTWSFENVISSVRFFPTADDFYKHVREEGLWNQVYHTYSSDKSPYDVAEPRLDDRNYRYSYVPLVVTLYEDKGFQGRRIVIVESCENIAKFFGDEYNDVATSVVVRKGPNYNYLPATRSTLSPFSQSHYHVDLFEESNYGGKRIQLIPGEYPNIGDSHNFNDAASSIQFFWRDSPITNLLRVS